MSKSNPMHGESSKIVRVSRSDSFIRRLNEKKAQQALVDAYEAARQKQINYTKVGLRV